MCVYLWQRTAAPHSRFQSTAGGPGWTDRRLITVLALGWRSHGGDLSHQRHRETGTLIAGTFTGAGSQITHRTAGTTVEMVLTTHRLENEKRFTPFYGNKSKLWNNQFCKKTPRALLVWTVKAKVTHFCSTRRNRQNESFSVSCKILKGKFIQKKLICHLLTLR